MNVTFGNFNAVIATLFCHQDVVPTVDVNGTFD